MANDMIGRSVAQRDEWARYQLMRRRESRYYTARIHELRQKYAVKPLPAWRRKLLGIVGFLVLLRKNQIRL